MAAKNRVCKSIETGSLKVGDSPVRGLHLRCICRGHEGWIGHLAWSPCGRFMASPSFDRTVRIWNAETGECVAVLRGHARAVTCVTWSPDGKMLGSAAEDVRIWRIEDPQTALVLDNSRGIKRLDWPSVAGVFAETELGYIFTGRGVHVVGASNESILFWELAAGHLVKTIDCPTREGVVACSPSTPNVVLAAMRHDVCLWQDLQHPDPMRLHGHRGDVVALAWSPDGMIAASGSGDSTIRIWDVAKYRQISVLEGHDGWVCELSFSADRLFLASKASDGTVRLWRCDDWVTVATLNEPGPAQITGLAFHPTAPVLVTSNFENDSLYVWDLDVGVLLGTTPENVIRYSSAKIVLVGETNAGKSCLAMRLAEDRYPRDDEQATTHGMRVWMMEAETLHPSATPPQGQRRDVVLWDFGGQNEYRLVHQLFLHDAMLALVLIDPTRAEVASDDAREWSRRLAKRFGGNRLLKLLVGAKQDTPNSLVNKAAIESLCAEYQFVNYIETSAKTGRNIDALRKAIATALDWENLAKTSRPELFQHIRDEIEIQRKNGEVALLLDDLIRAIRDKGCEDVEPGTVRAVSEQLAAQGALALTRLTVGQDILVIDVPVIERYAGSLIIAARDNPRGIPAIEERLLGSEQFPFPGIARTDRLHAFKERLVLECVAELMIEHGVCFRHEGLLVFPTLFPEAQIEPLQRLAHSVSLFYDFTGAIDNIYASLVARLVISKAFGEGRLWPGRFELDDPGSGLCGVQHIKYQGGLAHIDVFFAEETDVEQRRLFTRFVEDHLQQQGVEVREHEAIKCRRCGRDIAEDVVHVNIAAGQRDVICQWCRTATVISEGVSKIRQRDALSDEKIYALRMSIEKRTAADAEKAKQAVAAGERRSSRSNDPIRILHLSDLHFTNRTSPGARLQWLLQDIRGEEGFRADSIEYLVISGDLTDKGTVEGFEKARDFVSQLNEELGISAQRCILVPGNHDVQELEEAYRYYSNIAKAREAQPDERQWHKEGRVVFIPDPDKYGQRLKAFSDAFFHKLSVKPYPPDPSQQGIAYLFPDTGLQFLTLNSSWQIDQFHRKRSGLHPDAVAHVIRDAEKQVKAAIDRGEIRKDQRLLRLGVWHHAIQDSEMMQSIELIEILQNAHVRICLHGDVHRMHRDLFKYWHKEVMHVIGAGSFGSAAEGRPESIPRLYNLLEVSRDLSSVQVHTRRQLEPNGPWTGWNEWPNADGTAGCVAYYDIKLS